ncbi:MAG: ribosome small subunit-dependent GTPase A [Bacillota bacterium]|nr:ribosome small subunit-dependent GTPase A [Bacillota bacterium]
MPEGIIIKGIGGFYYVKTEEGLYECKARGVFRKKNLTPLPGDRVSVAVTDVEKKKGSISEILPRDSELVRPAVSNVNQLATVIAVKSPLPDFDLLDKLLVSASIKGIQTIICINKIDLDESQEYKKIIQVYSAAGFKCLPLSSKTESGFEQLQESLKGKTTVFAGQSGVGKSSILNIIMNCWVMQTGKVSEKIERGRHTTRHAELLELEEGGFVADTPGFSSFELPDIKYDELEYYYPEFESYLGKCRFKGCSHISEPDCAVKEALAQNLIDRERYERYCKFYNILKQKKDYIKRV